jgi:hypothetical protein
VADTGGWSEYQTAPVYRARLTPGHMKAAPS